MNIKEIKQSLEILRQEYIKAGGQPAKDAKHNPCPICGDKTGLSLFLDPQGQARFKCHSKCGSTGTVIDFVMLTAKLTSKEAVKTLTDTYGDATPSTPHAPPTKNKQESGRYFSTIFEVQTFWQDIFAKDGGQHQVTYAYQDQIDGHWMPVLEIFRFQMPSGKKEIRPARRVPNGWRIGLGSYGTPENPLPLYAKRALVEVDPSLPLHIVEGEKCAEALIRHGFLATTSCQGSANADKSDWSPARRFPNVFIWKDLDPSRPETGYNPGEAYVAKVRHHLDIAQSVRIVDLRQIGYQDGDDVADLVENLERSLDKPAIIARLEEVAATCSAMPLGDLYPQQPPPLPDTFGYFADPSARPLIRNFCPISQTYTESNAEGQPIQKHKTNKMQTSPLTIVKTLLDLTNSALCRIRAPGAREPLLFLETRPDASATPEAPQLPAAESHSFSGNCEGRIQWVQNSTQFHAMLQRIGKLQFCLKSDPEGTNYASASDVFHCFAEAPEVREYEAIQVRPHMPPMPGHYYAWRPNTKYQPNGSRLAGLLKFFANAKTPEHLALIAAACITPAWGGTANVRYGCRPLIVLTAADQGSGKTTIAQIIADLWGGWLPVALSQRAEDEFIQRALSPGGLLTRVAIIDNVLGTLKSGAIEGWITEKYIRGKRLYQGDASRPNDLTWLVTLNNARLSRDMSERAFFIELTKPEKRANWSKDVATYCSQYGAEIVLDCLAILATPLPQPSLGLSDRWALWAEEVLARACVSAAVREAVGQEVDVVKVLELNNQYRGECDVDIESAEEIWIGILERLALRYLTWDAAGRRILWPPENEPDVFISSKQMGEWMKEIQGRKELNAAWVRSFIDGHHRAGRLPHVWYQRTNTNRGYIIAMKGVREYLSVLAENPSIGPQATIAQ